MPQLNLREMLNNPTVKNTAIGLGIAVLVPIAVTYLAPLIRPVARSTLKIGLVTAEKGREMAAEFGEIFDDLVAEVREEMSTNRENAKDLLNHSLSGPGDTNGRSGASIQTKSEPSR